MPVFTAIIGAALISLAVSIDAFAASFAYGSKKIKIPLYSNLIIATVGSSTLALALLAGAAVSQHIPDALTVALSFTILFLIGLIKLMDSVTKSIIKKHNKACSDNISKKVEFSMFNFKFILNLYANPIDADIDGSKKITPAEAVLLATALSLDSLAVGFGAALSDINVIVIFLTSLVAGVIAVLTGCTLGNKLAKKTSLNVSWIGGVILIALAFSNLF